MPKTPLIVAVLLTLGAGPGFEPAPAAAGSTTLNHGVRVHRLMTPPSHAVIREKAPQQKQAVAPHRHRIKLHKGTRVIVVFGDGIGRSRYRRRYPGIARPWSRQHAAGRREFMNPRGLYTSKIYRRGYY